MSEQQQPKKTEAVADALAALAAGEHVEEAPLSGSGIAGQGESDHVQLTPAPVPPPPVAPVKPPVVAGGRKKVRGAGATESGKLAKPSGGRTSATPPAARRPSTP